MDQTKTPYFQALLDYVDSGVQPFHTPGHMQGVGMDRAFREFIGDNVCAIDLTPMPGIDDLLQPTESIREAKIQRQIDEFRDMRRNRFSMEN